MLIEIDGALMKFINRGMSFISDIELAIAALCYGSSSNGAIDFKALTMQKKTFDAYNNDTIRSKILQKLVLQCTSDYPPSGGH